MDKNPMMEILDSWRGMQQQFWKQLTGQMSEPVLPGPQGLITIAEHLARQMYDFQDLAVKSTLDQITTISASQPGCTEIVAEVRRAASQATAAQRQAFDSWCKAVRKIHSLSGGNELSGVTSQTMQQWQAATKQLVEMQSSWLNMFSGASSGNPKGQKK